MGYRHILLALELDPDNDKALLKKAKELVELFGAKLTLIHAIEHMGNYGAAYGVSAGVDIEEELMKEAQKAMSAIAKKLDVPKDRQAIHVGPAKQVVIDEAAKIGADLILTGSHGRHGVRLLLGSTANAILHGADCDVLAVRVRD